MNKYEFVVERFSPTFNGTFGRLGYRCCGSTETQFICVTLEPCKPIVSVGRYNLKMTFSPKFQKILPEIVVPQHSGVRIHSGNDVTDTIGCLLVGLSRDFVKILDSKVALKLVLSYIKELNIKSIVYE